MSTRPDETARTPPRMVRYHRHRVDGVAGSAVDEAKRRVGQRRRPHLTPACGAPA
jgi:hypothetical protein